MANQMNLGQLIDALAKCSPDKYVCFDWCGISPGTIESYRGYYDQIAISPTDAARYNRATVGKFLPALREAVGAVFVGYKGGNYVMSRETPVWVSPHGEASDTVIIGVEENQYRVVMKTEEQP